VTICTNCGQENPSEARFCNACAAEFSAHAIAAREVRKTVTAVFCDLVGSTPLGERLDSEALRLVMGRYFDEMRAVREAEGLRELDAAVALDLDDAREARAVGGRVRRRLRRARASGRRSYGAVGSSAR
jgi:hypothetical protein